MNLQDKKPQIFLIGVPKAGTTWLSKILDQHPDVCFSNPKEPNFIAFHKGTFKRSKDEPNWKKYDSYFTGEGLRIDGSIHAFACPLAPERIAKKFPNSKFILCLREPVSRTFSHWKMIIDTLEDKKYNSDWSDFKLAWQDDRLRCDSLYATSMERWLKYFSLDKFLIINSESFRKKTQSAIQEIEEFLDLDNFKFNFSSKILSNESSSRRTPNFLGRIIIGISKIIPSVLKSPIVKILNKREINIYSSPIISSKTLDINLSDEHYNICGETLCKELQKFEEISNFDTSEWAKKIKNKII